MSYANKEVRSFVKFLKKNPQVISIENLGKTKHIHLQIVIENNDGDLITIPKLSIPNTPSDGNWERLKIADINRIFRTHNISEIRR